MEAVAFDSLEKANEYIREEEIRHNAKFIVKYSKTMDPNKHIEPRHTVCKTGLCRAVVTYRGSITSSITHTE
ncbi:hypothetical protein DPMN_032329 [Dreissena polymorpha]|uniref:Uncharacterized protein n=1 Tax=Dreissena polymorpha TaxID=45954 RepID=A0A9D4M2N2_DREPO|nr:hypothetical protein DPMN_032329 [Dreissena polymorpha]